MSRKPSTKPWTQKHINEAKAALARVMADALARGCSLAASLCASSIRKPATTSSEQAFLADLTAMQSLSFAETRRILATVRARAEGRAVDTVEAPFFRVRHTDGSYEPRPRHSEDEVEETVEAVDAWWTDDRGTAKDIADCVPDGARVVRVTLKRTRITPAPKGGS